MIRMIQSTSADHAKAYFSDALLKADYYLNDQELQGKLLGKLAQRLDIGGIATKDNFFALCENRNPKTDKPLTLRTKDNRTTGYDINFHCPKSVSIVHALAKDDHLLKAFQESMQETMQHIEADIKTTVRKKGAVAERKTGEMVWAEFIHQTARPVDGSAPDPHLHGHCFVFNATYDENEKQIKAGQFRDIKRDMPYYQARFQKTLSDKLIKLGYEVRRTDKSFEIKGVPQKVIDMFSKRTNEIGEAAKEKNITDAKQLDKLGAMTRSKKQKGMTMGELKADWVKQINEQVDYDEGEKEKAIRYAPKSETEKAKLAPKNCIDHALHHSFERASVVADRKLIEVALKHSIGHEEVKVSDIENEFLEDKRLIHVTEKSRNFCTTKEVLTEEKIMVGLARQGVGKFVPLYTQSPEMDLSGQQAEAAKHLLTTKNQVSIIRGVAGAGKTNMMKKVVDLIKKTGKKMFAVAPSASASRGVLVEEGFKDATTVAMLLKDQKMQEDLKGQVLMVDEAGLLGTKDMAALLSLVIKQEARLILVGDTRQHASVVRGDALRILNTVGGIKTAEVSKIYRQRNENYRSAVEDLSKGNVKGAFERLDDMGFISIVDPMKPNERLVDDYMKTIKKGKSALIISPTHKQAEDVTDDVRKRMKSNKLIGRKEVAAVKLKSLNLTNAEKNDWRNFKKGQMVQFDQNVPKITRGSLWSVKDAKDGNVTLIDSHGTEQTLPRERAAAFSVYAKSEIGLAKNDLVRITHNGFDKNEKRLDNGTALKVVTAKKTGEIKLINFISKNIYELDKDFGHIDYDYCTTSHSAQGKTVDEVFISQPAATFPATDAKQFYVSVSRGRDAATIYTDDRDALLDYASRIGDRTSALELVAVKQQHMDYVQQNQRNDYQKVHDKQPAKETLEKIKIPKEINYEPGI